MDSKQAIEALLFSLDKPLTIKTIQDLVPQITQEQIQQAISGLKDEYTREDRSFEIVDISGGYQLFTKKEFDELISKLKGIESRRRLSRACIETLSIIAYKQPVIRSDIESIRGVASPDIIRALMELGLVKVIGRASTPGAPILYGTTEKFLEFFGLRSVEELPKPDELK